MANNRADEIRAALLSVAEHLNELSFSKSWPRTITRFVLIVEHLSHPGFPKEIATEFEKIVSYQRNVLCTRCDDTLFLFTFRDEEKRDLWAKFFADLKKNPEILHHLKGAKEEYFSLLGKYKFLED